MVSIQTNIDAPPLRPVGSSMALSDVRLTWDVARREIFELAEAEAEADAEVEAEIGPWPPWKRVLFAVRCLLRVVVYVEPNNAESAEVRDLLERASSVGLVVVYLGEPHALLFKEAGFTYRHLDRIWNESSSKFLQNSIFLQDSISVAARLLEAVRSP